MKSIDRGIVFQGAEGSELSSACFHDIAVLRNGRWLCSFRASPRKAGAYPQRILLTCSDDEGATWSTPVEPFENCEADGKQGNWRVCHVTRLPDGRAVAALYWVDASDPSLPFFNEETEGLLDSRAYLSFSEDNGETWSRPDPCDTSPFNMPIALTGPILVLDSGVWVLQFETNKPYDDRSVWHHASVFMFSSDGGGTWPESVKVAADPDARCFYWDQRPGLLAGGAILDTFWTFDREDAVYLNMHARGSTDGGRTWSELWDLDVPGQPGPPLMLPNGRVLLPYVDREGTPAIKARTSSNAGLSWPVQTELVLDDSVARGQQVHKASMQDAWSEMGAFSMGLPRTALLDNGDALVVYYAGPETDFTGIHWVRLRGDT